MIPLSNTEHSLNYNQTNVTYAKNIKKITNI